MADETVAMSRRFHRLLGALPPSRRSMAEAIDRPPALFPGGTLKTPGMGTTGCTAYDPLIADFQNRAHSKLPKHGDCALQMNFYLGHSCQAGWSEVKFGSI